MNKTIIISYCLLAFGLMACSSDDPTADTPATTPTVDDGRTAVNITTRSEGDPQGAQLQAGLYMVNYADGQADELLATDNYVNNQLLTWANDSWNTATPIYWNDDATAADFYAYAPYKENVSNARSLPVSVQADQSTTDAYAKSDLLWGCALGKTASDGSFDLTLTHRLSQLTVVVTAEGGFDENELQASDVSVTIGGTKTQGTMDLATGELSVTGEAQEVRCLSVGNLNYKAILMPQLVSFSNLITVNWKGNLYVLQNAFKLEACRQYTLTVKLKKTKSGFDIGIAGWDIIDEDFGGTIGG